jgi:predicted DNA-binding antitoxin AbrB/MazE fold protein
MFEVAHPMSFTIEAICENGLLKPARPLPLKEHVHLQLTIRPTASSHGLSMVPARINVLAGLGGELGGHAFE